MCLFFVKIDHIIIFDVLTQLTAGERVGQSPGGSLVVNAQSTVSVILSGRNTIRLTTRLFIIYFIYLLTEGF